MRWLIALALSIPALAHARPPGPPHGPKGPPPLAHVVERHASELDIGPELLEEIRRIDAEGRATAEPLHQAIRAAHDALRTAMDSDAPDPSTVFARSAELTDAEQRMRDHHLAEALDILALLTVEQRQTLKALRPERPRRR